MHANWSDMAKIVRVEKQDQDGIWFPFFTALGWMTPDLWRGKAKRWAINFLDERGRHEFETEEEFMRVLDQVDKEIVRAVAEREVQAMLERAEQLPELNPEEVRAAAERKIRTLEAIAGKKYDYETRTWIDAPDEPDPAAALSALMTEALGEPEPIEPAELDEPAEPAKPAKKAKKAKATPAPDPAPASEE